jgi:integrase
MAKVKKIDLSMELPKTRGNPQNHPKKGSTTVVQPIRSMADIQVIKNRIIDNLRDRLLFVLGVNNGLRTNDLLCLKVGQVKWLKPGDEITIKESKTKKDNILVICDSVYKVLKEYLTEENFADGDYLFRSRKGGNKPITIQTVNALIKKWTKAINLKENYGCHSLRKTWGYIQRIHYGVGFELIAKRFNHSNPSVTMRYLGIRDKEVINLLVNNEVG